MCVVGSHMPALACAQRTRAVTLETPQVADAAQFSLLARQIFLRSAPPDFAPHRGEGCPLRTATILALRKLGLHASLRMASSAVPARVSVAEASVADSVAKLERAVAGHGPRQTLIANVMAALAAGTTFEQRVAGAIAALRLAETTDSKHSGFSHEVASRLLSPKSSSQSANNFLGETAYTRVGSRARDEALAQLVAISQPKVLTLVARSLRSDVAARAARRGTSEFAELGGVWRFLPATASTILGRVCGDAEKVAGAILAAVGPSFLQVRAVSSPMGPLAAWLGTTPVESMAMLAAASGQTSTCFELARVIEAAAANVPPPPAGVLPPWVALFWPPPVPHHDGRGVAGPGPAASAVGRLLAWGERRGLPSAHSPPVPLPPMVFMAAALCANKHDKAGWQALTDGLPGDVRPLYHSLGLTLARERLRRFVGFAAAPGRKSHSSLAGMVARMLPATAREVGMAIMKPGSGRGAIDALPLPEASLRDGPMGDAGARLAAAGLPPLELSTARADALAGGFAVMPDNVAVCMVTTAAGALAAASIMAASPNIGLDCEWAPQPVLLPPAVLDDVMEAAEAAAAAEHARLTGEPRQPREPLRCVVLARRQGRVPPLESPVSLAQICTGNTVFLVDPTMVAADPSGGGVEALCAIGQALSTYQPPEADAGAGAGGAAATAPGTGGRGTIVGFGLAQDYSKLAASLRDVGATEDALLPANKLETLSGPETLHLAADEQRRIAAERAAGVRDIVAREAQAGAQKAGAARAGTLPAAVAAGAWSARPAGAAAVLAGPASGADSTDSSAKAVAAGAGAGTGAGAAAAAAPRSGAGRAGFPGLSQLASARAAGAPVAALAGASDAATHASEGSDAAATAAAATASLAARRNGAGSAAPSARLYVELQTTEWLKVLGVDERHASLSAIASATLGAPLDKNCQVSDWDRRPLSVHQALYAATDAFVPVDAFLQIAHGKLTAP